VALREQALGVEHPAVAADVAALAAILDAQGKDAEAETLYRRALAVFARVYGPDHYEMAVNANNLAALLHARGEQAEAERLYQRALAIKERLLGPEHPDVAITLSNLAALYASLGWYVDAEALYQRALPLFEQALGPTHPHAQTCRQNYASLLRETRRRTAARARAACTKLVRHTRRVGTSLSTIRGRTKERGMQQYVMHEVFGASFVSTSECIAHGSLQ
jgi:tetratricopeptide (TPR) repeat protein